MRLGIRVDAPRGDVFSSRAFEAQVGRAVPVHNDVDGTEDIGTIVAAVVAEDGSHVMLDVELAGVSLPRDPEVDTPPNVD
jgi:hypothetical protein